MSLLEGRNDLTIQQKNDAIASYIYDDFRRDNLAVSSQSPVYTNSTMPQDLQDAPPLVISTIFGNGSRYNAIDPKCRFEAYADIPNKMVFFNSSCENATGYSIIEKINVVLRQGAKVVFALEGGGGRCTLSTPITISSRSSYVRAFVDDSSCLKQGSNPSSSVTARKQIIFPRYVAFSRDNPTSFYTSMIGRYAKRSRCTISIQRLNRYGNS